MFHVDGYLAGGDGDENVHDEDDDHDDDGDDDGDCDEIVTT